MIALALGIVLCEPAAFSQSKQSALKPTANKLSQISSCLGSQYSQIHELEAGLLAGWGKWRFSVYPSNARKPATPPPADYMETLDRDLAACKAASGIRDPQIRRAILQSVSNDIAIKAADCNQFGMGRSVPVQVVTLRGKDPDNGWEVFYRWLSSSGLHVDELRIPKLTSPATIELPPGEYLFRAQKRTAAGELVKTDGVPITVGMRQNIECQLPVP